MSISEGIDRSGILRLLFGYSIRILFFNTLPPSLIFQIALICNVDRLILILNLLRINFLKELFGFFIEL